jgi:hypothetical protein
VVAGEGRSPSSSFRKVPTSDVTSATNGACLGANVPKEVVRQLARLLARGAAFPGRAGAGAALTCFSCRYLNEAC